MVTELEINNTLELESRPLRYWEGRAWPSFRAQGVGTLHLHFWDLPGGGPTCYPKSQTWIQIPTLPIALRPPEQMGELMLGCRKHEGKRKSWRWRKVCARCQGA